MMTAAFTFAIGLLIGVGFGFYVRMAAYDPSLDQPLDGCLHGKQEIS